MRNGRQRRAGFGFDPRLDAGDHAIGFLRAPMRHQPARTLRDKAAHQQDDEPDHATDDERRPPAPFRVHHGRIEHDERADRADRRAHPEAPIDDKIGKAAATCRNQLLDRGVHGRVLAADAGSGDGAEHRERPEIP